VGKTAVALCIPLLTPSCLLNTSMHVAVSVRTYSHRSSQNQQRVHQADYMVDESGATLNAVSRTAGEAREDEEHVLQETTSAASPTTSIFIRDWKVATCLASIFATLT